MSAPGTVRSSAATAHSHHRRAKWWTIARVLAALALAPLAAAASAIAYIIIPSDPELWFEYAGAAFLGGMFAYVVGGAGCVIGSLIVLALRWHRLRACAGLGLALGTVPIAGLVIGGIVNGIELAILGDLRVAAYFPVIGALVATLFWFVVFWRNPYYASKPG